MSSNLPPGCSSPDGGIDHAYEGALENLCEQMQHAGEVVLMERIAKAVLPWVRQSYEEGLQDGQHIAEQRAESTGDSE